MTFVDGTSASADIIIGADGIHSGVRKYVLGEGHPAVPPVPSGFWDARTIISYEEALAKLGPSCINKADPHQHIHIGSKGIFLHDTINNGESCCIIASGPVPPDWDVTKWTHTVTRKWLNTQYKYWGEYGQNSLDLVFGDREEIPAFVQWESAKAPTLYNGTICMIGDAAHATSPWQGSGLSQAIEDSLIVERLLGLCANIHEVPLALEIYDQIRRDRAQDVVDSSRKAAESYFSAWPGGAAQLRTDIPSREYILNWDTQGAVDQAIESFELLRKTNGHAEQKSSRA